MQILPCGMYIGRCLHLWPIAVLRAFCDTATPLPLPFVRAFLRFRLTFFFAATLSAGLHSVPWRRLQDRNHDPPAVQALPLPLQQERQGRGRQSRGDRASIPHADGGQEPGRERFLCVRLCCVVCVCVFLSAQHFLACFEGVFVVSFLFSIWLSSSFFFFVKCSEKK